MPVSASEAHSRANINMTCEQAIAEVGRACRFRDGLPAGQRPEVEVGVSTAFGCTIQGEVSGGLGDRDGGAPRPRGRRQRRPVRRRRLRQPGAGPAPVQAPARRTRREGGRRPPAQHPRPGPRQRRRGAGGRGDHLRRLAGRHRRLPVLPGRHGQHRHRGPGLDAGGHGPRHGRRPRQARRRAGGAGGGPARRAGLRPPARRRRGEGLPLRRARPGAGGHRQGPAAAPRPARWWHERRPASPCRSKASASSTSPTCWPGRSAPTSSP